MIIKQIVLSNVSKRMQLKYADAISKLKNNNVQNIRSYFKNSKKIIFGDGNNEL